MAPTEWRDEALSDKWAIIRKVRSAVTGALEVARASKVIGSSLEAAPKVYVETFEAMSNEDFAEACITSSIEVIKAEAPVGAFFLESDKRTGVVVEKAQGIKCARSWKISKDIGGDKDFPDITARDAEAVREWQMRNGKMI